MGKNKGQTNKHLIIACIFIIISVCVIIQVSGHGMLLNPPNRSSLWRLDEFKHLNPPKNYDDNALWCGNFSTQWDVNDGKCGVCGDNWSDPTPRENEDGGTYGLGHIVRNYTAGQVIPIRVLLTASHLGYFEIRLCASDKIKDHSEESCYLKNVLQLVNPVKSKTRYPITTNVFDYQVFDYEVRLPVGVRCNKCVIQWHYWTGNRWGECEGGMQNATGCGPQENFRGCADVAIL